MSLLLLLSDDGPTPAYGLNFMGWMPAGLTYTNSSTTRTYFGSDGLLKTAAADKPIFEYDRVTLALLGMRWEMEQRTNLALNSVFGGGGAAPTNWPQAVGTGTSAPVSSIYGNADTAVAYLQTATSQRPFFYQQFSVSANTTYTFSALIESVSGSLTAGDVSVFVNGPDGFSFSYPVCSANPSGGSGGVLTSGELRLQLSIAATAGTVIIRLGLGAAVGVTGTMQFSRPQFEVGASRSSFIPTAGSAVTRQPDVLTASSISPWYNQSEGTVVFEGIASDFSIERGNFLFFDGTNNNRQFSAVRSTGILRWYGNKAGAGQYDIDTGSITAGSVFRHVGAYRLNDFASTANGSAAAADTSGALPVGINELRFGAVAASLASFMGYARRFQYYNTRLPNSQIQGLSRV